METNERDSQARKVGPTVSKDKWVNHARTKLSRGYVLIVSKVRRNANFHSPEKGYEMCPYNVARQLIKEGLVERAGDHYLGDLYRLAADSSVPLHHRPAPPKPAADDLDLLLDQLDEGDALE